MSRAKVREVMSEQVYTISPMATLKEAAHELRRRRISGLPVVTDEGRLVGIISEADLLGLEARPTPGERSGGLLSLVQGRGRHGPPQGARLVGDVMASPVVTAHPDEDARKAARRMLRQKVKRLPVTDATKVVGIITRQDILRVFDRSDRELADAVERFLQSCGFGPPDAVINVDVVDGIVTLTGNVVYDSDTAVAGALAGSVDGAIDVNNFLAGRERNPGLRRIV